MADNYNLILNQLVLNKDAGDVIFKLRAVYSECKQVQAIIHRFSTDQAFSDAFDAVMYYGNFDGTIGPSQMLYNIGALVTAWEESPLYRSVLGLPDE